jgi:hypothetical protein
VNEDASERLAQLALNVGDRIIVIDGVAGFEKYAAIGRRATVIRVHKKDVCVVLDDEEGTPRYFPPEFIRPLDAVERLAELA